MWMMDMTAITAIILVLGPVSVLALSWTPIGRAITQRIKGHAEPDPKRLDDLQDALLELRDVMDQVVIDLDSLGDRVTFTERMLSSGKTRDEVLTPV